MPKNFSGQNLQGHSFRDQDLSEANFSYADIRGTNFTNATLIRANFNRAKGGLKSQWAICLLIISLSIAAIAGFTSALALPLFTSTLSLPVGIQQFSVLRSIVILLVFAVFLIVTIHQGLEASFWAVAAAGTTVVVAAGATSGRSAAAVAAAAATAAAGAGAVTGAVAVAIAIAIAVTETWVAIIAIAMAGAGAATVAGIVVGGVVMAVAGMSAYISLRALAGENKYAIVRRFAVTFAATSGTSFQSADLTDANFTQATLKNTNLSNAILKHTCWFQARKLDLARVSGTILINSAVRDLVTTGKGKKKSYAGRSLKGANLAVADISDANLTEADISEATLQGACLEGANLTKTQALGANFNEAKLTGACLEAWNIDSTTKLNGAICDYIYLLNKQQERRPSSGKFAPGEFSKLFQEVLNTVDLILRNGIDWKAFTYSFKKLQLENEDIELSIRGIENKGDGVVVVKVNVPADANKAKIHSDFTQYYQVALKSIEERYQVELKSKDEQIAIYRQHQANLQEVVKVLATRPVNVFEVGISADNISMDGKLVVLKLGEGDFEGGFSATLQIGTEGALPSVEIAGKLPSNPEVLKQYIQWQTAYRKSLSAVRIDVPDTQVTNVSKSEFIKECQELAEVLRKGLNLWLNSEQFRSIREKLLEKLTTSEEIRMIWQTKDIQLRRLPWHLWDFFERYPKAEIALSNPAYTQVEKSISSQGKVRILAILGNSMGIDVQKDQAMLKQLPDSEVNFLVEPQRKKLNDQLYQPWDILFFAGHSSSHVDGVTGKMYINQTDSLSIAELKNALKKAIAQGLQLAIFNSCDGLGLARELADLHIPQIIVMREPVPDLVAQEFLQHFLRTFAEGKSLYLAVREAREKLQGLEDQLPCATWLPVICQNPAEVPSSWHSLRG